MFFQWILCIMFVATLITINFMSVCIICLWVLRHAGYTEVKLQLSHEHTISWCYDLLWNLSSLALCSVQSHWSQEYGIPRVLSLCFFESTCAMTCVFTLTAIIFGTFMVHIWMYFKKYFPTFKKYLPTFQTLKLFIVGDLQMSYLMLLQCAVIRKLFFTMLTFVWFFTCMNSLVLFENI